MSAMNRRDFLLSAAAATLPAAAWAATAAGGSARLIVVMLRGAVDGLNVVIPYGDPAYREARPTIAVAAPGETDGALDLDGHFALHPALESLMPLWRAKQLAFVHASGSPDPTRSHFDAQLFIESGTPGRRTTEDGWMNRLLAEMPGPHGPADAIAIGPTLPQILKGRIAAANLPLGPSAKRELPIDRPEVAAAFDKLYTGEDPISRTYRLGRTARAELRADMPPEQEMADGGAPPANSLPAQARRLAYMIVQDRRIRLAFTALGGWDTHVNQGGAKGQLANRLRPLGEGISVLAGGLGGDWSETVVVVISEFGRTVHENGNGGTDHGHGNAIWVAGGRVHGGRVYGEWPGLTPANLYQGRDLAVTTDYRSVLATIASRHLRLADRELQQVFPGLPRGNSSLEQIVAA